jgi:D-xylose transport system permease protein
VVEGGGQNAYSVLTTFFLSPLTGYVLAAVLIAALWFLNQSARAARLKLGLPVADTERHVMGLIVAAQIIALVVVVANGYRGLPLALLILAAVALLVHVITRHTTFGRCLYAIGGNEEAAVVSGVPVRNTVIGAFGLMGLIVALTGFMQTAYSGATTTTIGSLMELDAIAACVIGGTSLRGGRGSVMGVLFGALIMASLLNGMTLMAVSPEIKYIARGSVLALAVWLDLRVTRRSSLIQIG